MANPLEEFQHRKFASAIQDSCKAMNPEILSGHEWLDYVRIFHKVYGRPIAFKPTKLSEADLRLRMKLVVEETMEMVEAGAFELIGGGGIWEIVRAVDEEPSYTGIVDALGDIMYVVIGFFIQMGINPDDIMREIQLSNMSKLGADGKPMLREDGKVLKGPNYFKPDFKRFMGDLK